MTLLLNSFSPDIIRARSYWLLVATWAHTCPITISASHKPALEPSRETWLTAVNSEAFRERRGSTRKGNKDWRTSELLTDKLQQAWAGLSPRPMIITSITRCSFQRKRANTRVTELNLRLASTFPSMECFTCKGQSQSRKKKNLVYKLNVTGFFFSPLSQPWAASAGTLPHPDICQRLQTLKRILAQVRMHLYFQNILPTSAACSSASRLSSVHRCCL